MSYAYNLKAEGVEDPKILVHLELCSETPPSPPPKKKNFNTA